MYDILDSPGDFFNHVKRVTASVASIVIFGFRAPTPDSFWATVSRPKVPRNSIV